MNHPNICVVHDVGHEENTHYLVMELIDGESLADRLERGPLPPSEVFRYGAQISDALDRAHKQGIVHRDLKPGNVMITKDGAKLLDFGLARPLQESRPVDDLTRTTPHAPAADHRGDDHRHVPVHGARAAGGTGNRRSHRHLCPGSAALRDGDRQQPAFKGASRTTLIAAIVSSEPPPISLLQVSIPPALDHVVRNCIQKSADERWQSAHDVASQLRWIGEAGSQAGRRRRGRHDAAKAAQRPRRWLAAVVGWIGCRRAGRLERAARGDGSRSRIDGTLPGGAPWPPPGNGDRAGRQCRPRDALAGRQPPRIQRRHPGRRSS